MRVEHSIEISAPLERVWKATMDVEDWPSHTPTMTRVKRLQTDEALQVGSTVQIKQPRQRAKPWTVTVLDPMNQFAWSAKLMGLTVTATHQLLGTREGTTNTLIVDLDGRMASLIGPMIRRPTLKAITLENEGFKRAVESISQ